MVRRKEFFGGSGKLMEKNKCWKKKRWRSKKVGVSKQMSKCVCVCVCVCFCLCCHDVGGQSASKRSSHVLLSAFNRSVK